MKPRNNLYHLVISAFYDFKRNKVRTLLTSLGIMIGVLSVVMLISLGIGLKNYLKQQFESLGSNILFIMPGNMFSGEGGIQNFGPGMMGGAKFDEKDLKILERISGVQYIAPVFMKVTVVKADGKEKFGNIFGSNEDVFPSMNLELLEGSFYTRSDNQRKSKKVVIGYSLAKELFDNPEDGVGKTIRFEDQRFTLIGVLKKKGDDEMDSGIFMPYSTTFGNINPEKTFLAIYIGVKEKDDVEIVKKEAESILLKRYEESDFSVSEQAQILSMVNQIFNILNSVLVAIGSISLLVGGIGIMNIMYATVTERIKEVGIRRAVGATQKDILLQFLTESVLLSLIGCILGLTISILIIIIVHPFFPVAINLLSVILTLVISSSIGIFFGVFPARRASKLPPIEAIRYE